jgi:hypothetical protein
LVEQLIVGLFDVFEPEEFVSFELEFDLHLDCFAQDFVHVDVRSGLLCFSGFLQLIRHFPDLVFKLTDSVQGLVGLLLDDEEFSFFVDEGFVFIGEEFLAVDECFL